MLTLTDEVDAGENAFSFRLPTPKSDTVAKQFVDLILARNDWMGHFSVIEPGRIRIRPLGS